MQQGTYKRIVLTAWLLTIVIYGLSKLAHHSEGWQLYLLQEEFHYSDKPQLKLPLEEVKYSNDKQPTLPPEEDVEKSDKKQPNLLSGEIKQSSKQQYSPPLVVKIDQFLLNLVKNQSKFYSYIKHLSSSQVEDLVRQLGVSSITSRKGQEEFLKCGGMLTLRWLKDPHPEAPIPVIPSHQRCKKMSFKSSGPLVSLSGVPGSGNSWVRQLLESATGIYTGSVWCDSSYIKAGMIGEGVDTNNVLAVKLHYYNPNGTKKVLNNDKSIYVVRSPFGAILSEHTRNVARNSDKYLSLGDSHVIEVDFKYENNPKWHKYVKKLSQAWKYEVKQWLNYRRYPILIIGYDNLRRDTYTELKKMLDFLGYPYSEDDVLCAVKNSGERFHRKHSSKDVHPYSPELQKFVLNEIKQVDAGLLKHNISLYHPYSEN